jgi:hypothetical protein
MGTRRALNDQLAERRRCHGLRHLNGNTQMNATSSAAVESARPMTDAQLDQLSINCIDLLRPWLMSPVPASNWESTP